jgi:glycosyltransferase involved in cell wall biosynthesis
MSTSYTVIICTYNRSEVLPRALEAINGLEAPAGKSWELIVVDNASTDATAAVVKDFGARSEVPVRYIREEQLGLSFARNTGIAAAQGEVVAMTDDDAMPRSDWLVRIDDAFTIYDAGIVFGPVRPAWEGAPPRWFSERFRGKFALLDYGDEPFLVSNAAQEFFGVNHAGRKTVFTELGGYREDLGVLGRTCRLGEDTDLFMRALARGIRMVYQPNVVVEHFIPASRGTKADLRRRIWQTRRTEYLNLLDKFATNPWLFGLPRWMFKDALSSAFSFAKSIYRRDPAETFFYEQRLQRFFVQLYQASAHGFCAKPPKHAAQHGKGLSGGRLSSLDTPPGSR